MSAASPSTSGESLATADMVTAPGPLEAGDQTGLLISGGLRHLTMRQQRDDKGPIPPSGPNQIMVEIMVLEKDAII